MEVSQINRQVTHAVISPHATIECGITDNAEFFQMLSSSLYRFPELAVARETICNSWDAHLEAGKEDTPIEITIDSRGMKFRDFGNGIPHDKIGPVYGVYGASTKKHDGRQTGGFGLGCKSPFAYTDHFGITSWNQGVKTIYRMSKSSAEVVGKPGITTIVQLPDTSTTGLEVDINFVSAGDQIRFMRLIRKVILNGGIKATINGEPVRTLDYSKAKLGYLITQETISDDSQLLYVLYGNVVYPIPIHEQYANLHSQVERFMGKLQTSMTPHLILLAPAHSIAVAPSRETLSMQSKTIDTIKTLLQKFLDENQEKVFPIVEEKIKLINHKALRQRRISKLLTKFEGYSTETAFKVNEELNDPEQLAMSYMNRTYPSYKGKEFIKKDYRHRLELLKEVENPFFKPFYDSYLKELSTAVVGHLGYYEKSNWLIRGMVQRIMRKFRQNGLDQTNLFVMDHNVTVPGIRGDACPVTKLRKQPLADLAPYLRGIIVLARTTKGLRNRMLTFPGMMYSELGPADGMFYVEAPRKQADLDKYREALSSLGMRFYDLTYRHPHEEEIIRTNRLTRTKKTTEKKEKEKGYPLLSEAIRESYGYISMLTCRDSQKKTETPEFFYRCNGLSVRSDVSEMYPLTSLLTKCFIELYGHRGVLITTLTQEEKLKKQGIIDFEEFIVKELEEFFWKKPAARREYSLQLSKVDEHIPTSERVMLSNLTGSDTVKYQLRLHSKLVHQKDKDKFALLNQMMLHRHRLRHQFSNKMLATINNIKPSKRILGAIAQVKGNELLKMINIDTIERIIKTNGPQAAQARVILKTALDG